MFSSLNVAMALKNLINNLEINALSLTEMNEIGQIFLSDEKMLLFLYIYVYLVYFIYNQFVPIDLYVKVLMLF